MFVGEVRWASMGPGSSWKLSGGSQLSSGATKVLEVAPSSCGQPAQELALVVVEGHHGGRGGGLAQQVGEARARRTRERRSGTRPQRSSGRVRPPRRGGRGPRGSGLATISSEERPQPCSPLEARGAGGGGGRRLPFEQAPLRDGEPHEGEDDRVDHVRGLVGQEGEADRGRASAVASVLEARAGRRPGARRRAAERPSSEGQEAGEGERPRPRQRPGAARAPGRRPGRREQREVARGPPGCGAGCRRS